MALVELYRKLIPEVFRNAIRIRMKRFRNARTLNDAYHYDKRRFASTASPFRDFRHRENLLAYAIVLAHSIEKGMSLPHPRPGFGVAKVENLARVLARLLDIHVMDSRLGHGIGVLRAWVAWNHSRNVEPPHALATCIADLQAAYLAAGLDTVGIQAGDNQPITTDAPQGSTTDWPPFAALAKSRHSIRHFSDSPVAIDRVLEAARTAQSTPTLCNRQSCHIHLFRNDEQGRRMLALQGGNSGFTDCIPLFAVITSELYCFLDTGERNQCWVEGGMFAMTFVHALHALGLGSCCLNWAKNPDIDSSMHALSGIPESERIIMLVAIGNTHADCLVTDSPTRASDEVIHTHWNQDT